MLEKIIKDLIDPSQLGLAGVFLALYLVMFYYSRKDAKLHRDDYKDVVRQLMSVVEKSTEASTKQAEVTQKLSEIISSLRDQISRME